MSNKNLINNLKKIKNLDSVGRPEASWVSDNRDILMRQINPQNKIVEYKPVQYYSDYFNQIFRQQVLRPAMMAILVFGAYFGYSAMSLVAKASLPGESLYPIKVLGENIQMAATLGDDNKVKLKMDFISRRGDELQQLAKKPEDPKIQSLNISTTVKKITAEVQEVQVKIDKMAKDASATTMIDTAKKIDDKTLKVEKDIVDAHASLTAEVKKDVAKDMKEAIATTEAVGTSALTVMVNKSADQEVKDSNHAVSDKELTTRVSDRIQNTEIALALAAGEVSKIATATPAVIGAATVMTTATATSTVATTTTIKDAMADVTAQPKVGQAVIEQAKNLLEKKDFTSALLKIVESKAIAADVLEKAPLLDEQIKIQVASSTAATAAAASSSSSTTATPAVTNVITK